MNRSPDDDAFDIDSLLRQRAVPRAPHDLSERIIYRAVRTPQMGRISASSLVGEFFSFITVPRPALAFGLCLMIGMFSGWASTQHVEADDTINDATQAINMVVIEEEWL